MDLFNKWLLSIIDEKLPDGIVALCFNLYESFAQENQFDVQLIGSPIFDYEDSDWACNEIFTTGENVFSFYAENWETALEKIDNSIRRVMEIDQFFIFFNNKHIAYGFVDGDLTIIR